MVWFIVMNYHSSAHRFGRRELGYHLLLVIRLKQVGSQKPGKMPQHQEGCGKI